MSRVERAVLGLLRAPTYPITVIGIEDLTDHYRRVHFHAPELLGRHHPAATSWLRLWIPAGGRDYQRAYTLTQVRPDAGEFAMEFCLHNGDGVGAAWARSTRPGAWLAATVYGSRPFVVPGPAPAGYLLLGDPTSLAAVNDILRTLPSQLPAYVVLQQLHPGDPDLPVHARPGDEVSWVGCRPDGPDLPTAIRDLDGEISGWGAWAATETAASRQLRSLLRERHRLPRSAVTVKAYWTRGRAMGTRGPVAAGGGR